MPRRPSHLRVVGSDEPPPEPPGPPPEPPDPPEPPAGNKDPSFRQYVGFMLGTMLLTYVPAGMLGLILGQARWQLIPAIFASVILGVLLVRRFGAGFMKRDFFRWILIICTVSALIISVFAALQAGGVTHL
jgi:hypothetical protein